MKERLISHNHESVDIDDILLATRQRICAAGDKEHATVAEQLKYLDELSKFELGRFLLKNRGLNGYWIHQILLHPWRKKVAASKGQRLEMTGFESFLYERAPAVLATQERFGIFLREIQHSVKEGACLASIPSGLLGELLYLNLEGIDTIRLVGVDYDAETLKDAKALARELDLAHCIELKQADAWQLEQKNTFDLISSNGLNIYEPSGEKVVALYREFYKALKPGGKLVTSFVTPPPQLTEQCEWKMDCIDQQDLLVSRILFVDILEAKWQCYRSSKTTQQQLETAGFSDICFHYDKARLYPTVVACKPK